MVFTTKRSSRIILYSSITIPELQHFSLGKFHGHANTKDFSITKKKAMRIICHSDYRAHTDSFFKGNNILKVNDIYNLNLGTFICINWIRRIYPKYFTICSPQATNTTITLPGKQTFIISPVPEHYLPIKFLQIADQNSGTPYHLKYAKPLQYTLLKENWKLP